MEKHPEFINLVDHDEPVNNMEFRNSESGISLNLSLLISNYNKRIFAKFFFTEHSLAMIISIIFMTVLYIFNSVEFHNKCSVWLVFCFLIITLISTATIFYFQNRMKLRGFQSESNKRNFCVKRGEFSKNVKEENLICGDIIKLHSGEIVPADIRITNCQNLKIKNLTLSNQKTDSDFVSYPTDENIFKSKNILFQGSKIISGNVSGIVFKQGHQTILDQALHQLKPFLSKNQLNHKYAFTHKLFRHLSFLTILWLVLTIICITFLYFTGFPPMQLAYISIGLWTSILTPTIILIVMCNLSIFQRHFSNCALKKPEFVVTLGKTDVIFINDMSLLYQNQFSIFQLWIDGFSVSGEEVATDNGENKIHYSESWTALTRASILCNESDQCILEGDGDHNQAETKAETVHNEIDESLLRSFKNCESIKKWGGSMSRYRQNNVCLIGPKYDSLSNCKLSIHRLNDGDLRFLMIMRGNVGDILKCCSSVLIGGKEEKIELWEKSILQFDEKLKGNCSIVKAFCDVRLNPEIFNRDLKEIDLEMENFIPRKGLRFIGIVSFIDSLKPSIPTSISRCKNLGIRLVFTYENNSNPIISMSKELNPKEFKVVSASKICLWPANVFTNTLNETNLIITETDKKTKENLIKVCQDNKMHVGIIESDVRDLSNILKSNVGIVTQLRSNNLCKQLADICMSDDNFETLIGSIEKSRKVSGMLNIILTILHYPKIPLVFGFLLFSFLGVPLVINLSFVLALELCFLFPTIYLSLEKLENVDSVDKMSTFMNCGLVNQIGCIQLAGCVFSYIVVMTLHGFWPSRLLMIRNIWYSPTSNDIPDSYGQEWTYSQRMKLNLLASSVVFVTIGVLQITAIITTISNNRSIFTQCIRKYRLLLVMIFSFLVIIGFIYGLSRLEMVELCPVEIISLLVPLPFAFYIVIFTEIRKLIRRNYNQEF